MHAGAWIERFRGCGTHLGWYLHSGSLLCLREERDSENENAPLSGSLRIQGAHAQPASPLALRAVYGPKSPRAGHSFSTCFHLPRPTS